MRRFDREGEAMSGRSDLVVRGYVFDVDDEPMWGFHGAARFVAEGPEDERAFVRECGLRMLEVGAIPYGVAARLPRPQGYRRSSGGDGRGMP